MKDRNGNEVEITITCPNCKALIPFIFCHYDFYGLDSERELMRLHIQRECSECNYVIEIDAEV